MSNSSNQLVDMLNVTKSFGGVTALKRVDFSVGHGEIVGLVGDNGAGKSTLIKILSGVYPADDGEIYFEKQKLSLASPADARARGIETVYQDLALVDYLNVWRNFFLGRELTTRIGFMDMNAMRKEVTGVIQDLGISLRQIEEPVSILSGGERQAVSISRTWYFKAKVVILDEPTNNLGIKESRKVLERTQMLKENGISVVLITHNIHHVYGLADKITVLFRGQKVADLKKEETDIEEIEEAILTGQVTRLTEDERLHY